MIFPSLQNRNYLNTTKNLHCSIINQSQKNVVNKSIDTSLKISPKTVKFIKIPIKLSGPFFIETESVILPMLKITQNEEGTDVQSPQYILFYFHNKEKLKNQRTLKNVFSHSLVAQKIKILNLSLNTIIESISVRK